MYLSMAIHKRQISSLIQCERPRMRRSIPSARIKVEPEMVEHDESLDPYNFSKVMCSISWNECVYVVFEWPCTRCCLSKRRFVLTDLKVHYEYS